MKNRRNYSKKGQTKKMTGYKRIGFYNFIEEKWKVLLNVTDDDLNCVCDQMNGELLEGRVR